jgi:GPH family glycoside/pentoside/hexuronide:cation symporter
LTGTIIGAYFAIYLTDGVASAHALPWSIIPDAIEYMEWQTGERHEGMVYRLITLAQKVAVSIALPLALLVLQYSGYLADSNTQPTSAVTGIRIIASPIPTVLLAMGILFAAIYPLGRENYSEIARKLEERHKAAAQKPSEVKND